MILGFYQQINGRPTHFREKIKSCVVPMVRTTQVPINGSDAIASAITHHNQMALPFEIHTSRRVGKWSGNLEFVTTFKPKRHTIRQDKSNRWKAGRKIQMVYRGPKYSIADHFNKGICELEECKLVQKITIKWRRPSWLQKDYGDQIPPFTLKVKNQYLFIYIDDKLIGQKTLRELAINDGFDSITEFLQYFKKTIINWRILHWTNIQY